MSSKRERELADFGELRACQLLRQEGFVVERMPRNFHFFDLMATRGSCRLLVPVKTRNKTTSNAPTLKRHENACRANEKENLRTSVNSVPVSCCGKRALWSRGCHGTSISLISWR